MIFSITPLMVSSDALGPLATPCQQEVVIEYTSLSLFLTAVRVIIEKEELKGRMQEVNLFPKDGD
jgi:hypothetical protein